MIVMNVVTSNTVLPRFRIGVKRKLIGKVVRRPRNVARKRAKARLAKVAQVRVQVLLVRVARVVNILIRVRAIASRVRGMTVKKKMYLP